MVATLFVLAVLGVHALAPISLLDSVAVVVCAVAALWWIGARNRQPQLLNRLSLAALGITSFAYIVQGGHWQLVPWGVVAALTAAFAGLRMWRPGHSIKLTRILGRILLVVALLAASLALMIEPLPSLPAPSGPFSVGSEVFHWTDTARDEVLTAATEDAREVVAQAWYPTDAANGDATAYIGTDAPTSPVDGLPAVVFEDYDAVDTHAVDLAPVSADSEEWPVLLFSPGLGVPRQSYTALCVELASRGYVVVSLSHPYDSPALELADGRVVTSADVTASAGAKADQIAIRAQDASFVLDQLSRIEEIEPNSPLVGNIDTARAGVFGHSFGGATAVQGIANDPRFLAGLNIDGNVWGSVPALDRPFLWVQAPTASTPLGQDELFEGLTRGGQVVTVDGTVHMSFSDYPAYLTPVGRQFYGRFPMVGWGTARTAETTPPTADIVSAFFGPILGADDDADLEDVAEHYPEVTIDRAVEARNT